MQKATILGGVIVGIRWLLAVCLASLLVVLGIPMNTYAHGVQIHYTADVSIEIVARYDAGEPMSGAQVVVYAPDDLTTPWLTGVCDEEGRFAFTPDTSKPGTWDVQVRKAGHGDIVHIAVGEGTLTTSDSGSYSVLQIVLMSACVIWGIAGTTLYFLRKKA